MDLNTDDPNNSGKTAQVQLCEETITKGKQEAKTFPPAVEACAQHCSRNKCCGKNPNICSQSNPNRENDVYHLVLNARSCIVNMSSQEKRDFIREQILSCANIYQYRKKLGGNRKQQRREVLTLQYKLLGEMVCRKRFKNFRNI